MPVVPIRWVLIRAPETRFQPQALLRTDLTRDPVQIVVWFMRRWSVEVIASICAAMPWIAPAAPPVTVWIEVT